MILVLKLVTCISKAIAILAIFQRITMEGWTDILYSVGVIILECSRTTCLGLPIESEKISKLIAFIKCQ